MDDSYKGYNSLPHLFWTLWLYVVLEVFRGLCVWVELNSFGCGAGSQFSRAGHLSTLGTCYCVGVSWFSCWRLLSKGVVVGVLILFPGVCHQRPFLLQFSWVDPSGAKVFCLNPTWWFCISFCTISLNEHIYLLFVEYSLSSTLSPTLKDQTQTVEERFFTGWYCQRASSNSWIATLWSSKHTIFCSKTVENCENMPWIKWTV